MTDFDPTQLNALVGDLVAKKNSLQTSVDADTAAQTAATAAQATAAGTFAAKGTAQQALNASVDALEAYANSLKG
jgi:hypothetical protein